MELHSSSQVTLAPEILPPHILQIALHNLHNLHNPFTNLLNQDSLNVPLRAIYENGPIEWYFCLSFLCLSGVNHEVDS